MPDLVRELGFGGVQTLLIAARSDSTDAVEVCSGALDAIKALPSAHRPVVVGSIQYSAEQAARPAYLRNITDAVVKNRVQGFIGCDSSQNTKEIASLFDKASYYPKALFLAAVPTYPEFVAEQGSASADVLGLMPWNRRLRWALQVQARM